MSDSSTLRRASMHKIYGLELWNVHLVYYFGSVGGIVRRTRVTQSKPSMEKIHEFREITIDCPVNK